MSDADVPTDGATEAWKTERAILLRRIKNQRRELRRLNADMGGMRALASNSFERQYTYRRNAYQHAAQIAEKFWFGGRIAAVIRKNLW